MEFDNEEYTRKKYIDNPSTIFSSCDHVLQFVRGESILDIGCGDGHLLKECLIKFKKSMGIEMSKVAYKICISKNLNVYNVSIEEFETERKFDTIVAIDVLEHVKDIRATCNKIIKLLSDDGIFLVVIPNPKSIKCTLGLVENPKLDPAHIYCPTYIEAKEIFRNAGFNIVKSSGIGKLNFFPRLSSGMFFILNKYDSQNIKGTIE